MASFRQMNLVKKLLAVAAGIILLLTLIFVVFHELTPAIPEGVPEHLKDKRMGAYAATASAVQNTVSLLVTISLALSALLGFAVKDNLATWSNVKVWSLLALALYGYFLSRVFLYAYEIHYVIAVQLDAGVLFLGKIQPLIRLQTKAVLFCALIATGAFAFRSAR